MPLEVSALPTGSTDGVIVRGVTDDLLEDPRAREQLRRLWVDRGLLVFKGENSAALHVNLSKVFGELERHPIQQLVMEGLPELIELHTIPGKNTVYQLNGELVSAWIPWHTDLIYVSEINHGGILRGIEIPPKGGITGFMDKIKTYDSLPKEVKRRIENLSVVYKTSFNMEDQRYAVAGDVKAVVMAPRLRSMIDCQVSEFPEVVHPMVFVQPSTGRKMLNLSPLFADRIPELDEGESDDLLGFLVAHINKAEFSYFHTWSTEDMVLWDNWRMWHCALGVAPTERRVMQRTTIAGDYAKGRRLAAYEAAAV